MLVSPDIRRVDRERPLQGADRVILDDHVLKDLLPGAILGPDPQSFVQRLPRPVLLRHVPPRRTGPQPPQDPVDHLPVIPPPATPTTIRRGQQRLDPRPGRIRQLTTPNTHEPDITNPVTRAFTGQALVESAQDAADFGDCFLGADRHQAVADVQDHSRRGPGLDARVADDRHDGGPGASLCTVQRRARRCSRPRGSMAPSKSWCVESQFFT